MPLAIAVIGLVGLLIGSFLNVGVWRVPPGEALVQPRPHCPQCGSPIRPRDNVPVLSWLVMRGKCRDCRGPISARYPAVELLTAVVWVAFALRIGLHADLPAYLYLGAVGVALALIDLDTKKLPNSLVLPSYPVALALLGVAAAVQGDATAYIRALIGMAVLFAFYFALAFVYPAGMGFGDVKLSGVLGLYLGWLGWGSLAVGAFLGFLPGGAVGGALMGPRGAGP